MEFFRSYRWLRLMSHLFYIKFLIIKFSNTKFPYYIKFLIIKFSNTKFPYYIKFHIIINFKFPYCKEIKKVNWSIRYKLKEESFRSPLLFVVLSRYFTVIDKLLNVFERTIPVLFVFVYLIGVNYFTIIVVIFSSNFLSLCEDFFSSLPTCVESSTLFKFCILFIRICKTSLLQLHHLTIRPYFFLWPIFWEAEMKNLEFYANSKCFFSASYLTWKKIGSALWDEEAS